MRFYKTQHSYYCGIDLHARSMFTHILDHEGKTAFERDLPAGPDAFLDATTMDDLEAAAEASRALPRTA